MLNDLAVSYSYTTTTTTSSSHFNTGAFLAIFLVALVLGIIAIIGMWKVFVKAGKPGWAAIVPIYNSWTLFEIAGKPGWWALLSLLGVIPVVGFLASIAVLVLYVIAALEIAKRFGKSTTFAIFGLIIFSFIGYVILGFGDAKYNADAAPAVADPGTPTTPAPPHEPTTPAAPAPPAA